MTVDDFETIINTQKQKLGSLQIQLSAKDSEISNLNKKLKECENIDQDQLIKNIHKLLDNQKINESQLLSSSQDMKDLYQDIYFKIMEITEKKKNFVKCIYYLSFVF